MKSIAILVILLAGAISSSIASDRPHKMVVYWGQQWINRKPLEHYCLNSNYDKIVLSFLQVFFDSRNKGKMPAISFSNGCTGPVASGYPTLLRCPDIERGIRVCQQRGIPVTLSLGGYVGDYEFKNKKQVRKFASTIWNLFLNGKLKRHLRPFGDVVLDGIDLNIERGTSYGYAHFVEELDRYMTNDKTKDYIITTPPGCPYPDRFLGPDTSTEKGTALTLHGEKFSDIYVQFYCCGCSPGNDEFWRKFEMWTNFSNFIRNDNGGKGPKVYIGLPAHEDASGIPGGHIYFRPVNEIKAIYERAKLNPGFGGFMMWNCGFDDLSRQSDGRTYGDHLVDILKGL